DCARAPVCVIPFFCGGKRARLGINRRARRDREDARLALAEELPDQRLRSAPAMANMVWKPYRHVDRDLRIRRQAVDQRREVGIDRSRRRTVTVAIYRDPSSLAAIHA